MSRSTATAAMLVFGAVLLAGVVLGLSPVTAGGISCGSAFGPDESGFSAAYTELQTGADISQVDCFDARNSRATISWTLLAIGAIGAGYSWWTRPSKYAEMSDDEILRRYGADDESK